MKPEPLRLTQQQQESSIMNPTQRILGLTLATSACLLTACGDYAEVQVLRPAEIQIVEDIQTVVVIDRAAPRNFGEELLSGVEGLGSGEGILADRESRTAAVQEVINVLTESPRFDVRHVFIDTHEYGSSIWDSPMDPWEVQSLCAIHSCDGVISLDAFDSDTDVFELIETLDADSEAEVAANIATYILRRETNTVATWRFYDGFNGRILDSLREHRVEAVDDQPALGRHVCVALSERLDAVRVQHNIEALRRVLLRDSPEVLARLVDHVCRAKLPRGVHLGRVPDDADDRAARDAAKLDECSADTAGSRVHENRLT